MSTPKWTPGSWDHASHPAVEEIQLAEHDKGTMRAIGDSTGHDLAITYGSCSKANAHLIAAAPELYEALKQLASAGNQIIVPTEAMKQALRAARDVMCKARGEAIPS